MKIDNQLLVELGLGELSDEAKASLLKHLVDELEMNVGTVIASQLNEDQIQEFEKLIDANDQPKALAWLQANYPDYKRVVQAELTKLKDEIKQKAPAIIAADKTG
jgi:hypothetical protein